MTRRKKSALICVMLLIQTVAGCGTAPERDVPDIHTTPSTGEIYLYGETHGVDSILAQELERWQAHYHEEGLRHLFVELPYYTAELLNLYLQEDDEETLDAVYEDWEGTAAYVPAVKEFYRQIKETCPDTVFHGTDVGHQYSTTGERYLTYLKDSGLQDSQQYELAEQAIEQGKTFYRDSDYEYRENRMVENFIRAFDGLEDESVMGIYGTAHTAVDAMAPESRDVVSMAGQLHDRYGDALHIEELKEVTAPLRMDTITVEEKSYTAAYLGRQELSELLPDYLYREFWRLEDAYPDFKDHPKTGDVLPYDNYPAQVETEQVFVVEGRHRGAQILSRGRRQLARPSRHRGV